MTWDGFSPIAVEYWDLPRLHAEQELPYTEKVGRRGRVYCYCGAGPRSPWWSNRSGCQWRARIMVMLSLGRMLRSDEHVHHKNHDCADDRLENLELVLAEYHGRYHATAATLGGYRDELGRFTEFDEPINFGRVARLGPILGHSATRGR